MKIDQQIFLSLLFLVVFGNRSLADSQPVDSRINKVTVFLSGAQVSRTSTVSIGAGVTELVFKNISPKLDKQSIQVKGDGAFTILSVSHQMNYLNEQKKREEIAELDARKYQLNEGKKTHQAMLAVLSEEKNMLSKNQSVGGANTGVVANELIKAVNFQRERLTAIATEQLGLQKTLMEIDSTIAKIDKQLKALHKEKETATSEITVTVSAKDATTAKFDISYYVLDAGWFATYDLRVKDINTPINLSFKANVFQQSGEDWNEVDLTISSGDPTVSGFAQSLSPWYLRYGSNRYPAQRPNAGAGRGGINNVTGIITDVNGEPLIGATVLLKGTSIGTVTDIDGRYTLNLPPDPATLVISYVGFTSMQIPVNSNVQHVSLSENTEMLSEVVVTGMASKSIGMPHINFSKIRGSRNDRTIAQQNVETFQATTISFEIESKYTIPSDGKTRMVDIKTESVPTDYQYFAAPKLDENAYLTAHITDWQDLNLLDGEVNLFFEGTYLGKSLLDTRNAEDTMEVSLGVDKAIVVKRKKLKDYVVKRFLGNHKIETRAFEIYVRNNKQENIRITIEDQFPISTNKEIEVTDLEYKGAMRDEKTEILTWEFVLPAKSEKTFEMKYSVKFPKRQYLTLD